MTRLRLNPGQLYFEIHSNHHSPISGFLVSYWTREFEIYSLGYTLNRTPLLFKIDSKECTPYKW